MSEAPAKDTIYIDNEDEITAIIEKVRGSKAKVVALVLPKRSATMQSVVNLKLLQRTATNAKKNLVLITSDPNLLPLAGAVGLHVAKTPQSKPEIPDAPVASKPEEHIETVEAAPIAAAAAAGVVAGAKAKEKASKSSDSSSGSGGSSSGGSSASSSAMPAVEDTIDLDNDKSSKAAAGAVAATGKKDKKKKIKVPDFDKFRVLLFGGIALLILLLVGGYFAMFVLPKATIVLKTDTSTVNTDLTLVASTTAKTVDVEKNIVPATNKELKKTDTEKAPATGQRDDGTKATGEMTIYNCTDADITIPAGTAFTNSGISFGANTAIKIPASDFFSNGTCKKNRSADVPVTALKPGDNANLSAGRDYTSNIGPTLTGKGSVMTGGTTKITKVVSQSDVDGAKQKAIDRMTTAAGEELKNQFTNENMLPLTDTLTAGTPAVTSSPNVNSEGNEVTVNVTITFSELGVKKDDLKEVVEASAKKEIDTTKQVIQDNGISSATIRTTENKTADGVKFQLQATVVAGPQLDAEGIKKEVAGTKKSETVKIIETRPGIKEVEVKYSPFWVASTPKKTGSITIEFQEANGN